LMKGGQEIVMEAEREIYESSDSLNVKADLLTAMAIFGGLISPEIPVKLLERRRDIMIESAAYELIKQEGIEEGIRQGMQQGIQEGFILDAREMVMEALQERFGVVDVSLLEKIESINNRQVLKGLLKMAIRARDLAEFAEKLNSI